MLNIEQMSLSCTSKGTILFRYEVLGWRLWWLCDWVVVDVNDTVVNTQRRIRAVWQYALGKELDLDAVESLSSRQILERFGGSNENAWIYF